MLRPLCLNIRSKYVVKDSKYAHSFFSFVIVSFQSSSMNPNTIYAY